MNKTISWLIVLVIAAAGIGIGFLSLSRPEVKGADENVELNGPLDIPNASTPMSGFTRFVYNHDNEIDDW